MNFYADRFKGKVVLVTGGTSGIGRATCLRAGAEGAFVVVSGRSEERGKAVVDAIVSEGGKAAFIPVDITQEDSVKELFRRIDAEVGPLDVAVNNAGVVGRGERVDELSTEEWMRVMNTNLNGVFYCCREEAARMTARNAGGAIINVSSVTGVVGFYRAVAYVTSKHGINGLTKAMANDLAPFNIRVNSICPGTTGTPLIAASGEEISAQIKQALAEGKTMEEAKAGSMGGMAKTGALLKRISTPEEQAAAILYLASEEGSFITGAIMPIDGGFTAF